MGSSPLDHPSEVPFFRRLMETLARLIRLSAGRLSFKLPPPGGSAPSPVLAEVLWDTEMVEGSFQVTLDGADVTPQFTVDYSQSRASASLVAGLAPHTLVAEGLLSSRLPLLPPTPSSAAVPFRVVDFSLWLASPDLWIEQGQSASVRVEVAPLGGFSEKVVVRATDLPVGVTVAPLTIAAGESSGLLAFTAAGGAGVGTASVVVTAEARPGGQSLRRSQPLDLTVAEKSDFVLQLASTSPQLEQGQSSTLGVTIVRTGNFQGDVAVAITGLPSGVSAVPLILRYPQTAGFLQIQAGNTAALGTKAAIVMGEATIQQQIVRHSQFLNVTVVEKADFSLRLPAEVAVERGKSGDLFVTVQRSGSFRGDVAVTAAGLPQGVVAGSLVIPAAQQSGFLTLTAADSTELKRSAISVTGEAIICDQVVKHSQKVNLGVTGVE